MTRQSTPEHGTTYLHCSITCCEHTLALPPSDQSPQYRVSALGWVWFGFVILCPYHAGNAVKRAQKEH